MWGIAITAALFRLPVMVDEAAEQQNPALRAR
jgi:hypothetical protein